MLQSLRQCRFGYQVLYLAAVGLLIANILTHLENRSIAADRSQAVASEYDLKLVRLYATSKFITWPDEAAKSLAPFVIGVVDTDPFQGGLQKLTKRKLKDRPIHIVMIKSEKDYQPCHLLFIPRDANAEIADAVLKRISNEPVLVWRDEPDPLKNAGVSCTFVLQGESLLIEADPTELKRRKLEPDGQLLSLNLVRIVKSGK